MRAGALVFGVLALFAPGRPAAAELKLTIHDGRVTLVADAVTVRQILDEWARVGQTRIVNADKVTGPPVTFWLLDVPEMQALEALLRPASGYLLAPRPLSTPGGSRFDRIFILPTSRPPATPAAAAQPAPFVNPANPPRPAGVPLPAGGDPDEPSETEVPQPAGVPGSLSVPPQMRPPGVGPMMPLPFQQQTQPPSPGDLLQPGAGPENEAAEPSPELTPAPLVPQTAPRPGMIVSPPTPPQGVPAPLGPPGAASPTTPPRRPGRQ